MLRVIIKTTFMLAIIINKKVVKIKASILAIQVMDIWFNNNCFYDNSNKLFNLSFEFINYNFFYYYQRYY